MTAETTEPLAGVVVFGGGLLGAAIGRRAAADGHRVVVASPTPRSHAGMWCRWREGDAMKLPLMGARVCFALGPAPGADGAALWGTALPRAVLAAWRGGAASVTVCGPAGSADGQEPGIDAFHMALAPLLVLAPRTTVLRFGPLFGVDDACAWPLLSALRQRGVARLPRGLPATFPLATEDAARAVLRSWDMGGQRVLRGADRIGMAEVGEALTRRFGGRWVWRWWPGDRHAARLRAWEHLSDDWDDAALGARQPFTTWLERLPGLRRKR